jgi:hypothetical protein
MVEERLWQKVDFEGAPTSLYKIEIRFKHFEMRGSSIHFERVIPK